jgi:hypothetical protein
MANLRSTIRRVQILENRAAEKAGVRFMLIDEARLVGPGRDGYIAGFVEMVVRVAS